MVEDKLARTRSVSLIPQAFKRLAELMKLNNENRSGVVQSLVLSAPDVLPEYTYRYVDEPSPMLQGVPWYGEYRGKVRVHIPPKGTSKLLTTALDLEVYYMTFDDFVRTVQMMIS